VERIFGGKNSNKFKQWFKNGVNLPGILQEKKVLLTFRYALHIVVNY
jgi:hypothetical protein